MSKILFEWNYICNVQPYNHLPPFAYKYRVVQRNFGDCVLENRIQNAMGEFVWVEVPFGDRTEVAFWDLVRCIEHESVTICTKQE